jgi:hypothetical protein
MVAGVKTNRGTGHLATEDQQGDEVVAVTVDQFVCEHGIGRVDFIKIDIEGAEIRCLRGALRTIKTHRPILMMEVNPSSLRDFDSSEEELEETVTALGYDLRVATWRGLVRFTGRVPRLGQVNVFAIPRR